MKREMRRKPERDPNAVLASGVGVLRLSEILRLLPICRSTWVTGVKSGRFPPPLELTPNSAVWRVADVRRCIDQLKPRRRCEPALAAAENAACRAP